MQDKIKSLNKLLALLRRHGLQFDRNDMANVIAMHDEWKKLKQRTINKDVLNIHHGVKGITGKCPQCETLVLNYYNFYHCGTCGQHLNWGVENGS